MTHVQLASCHAIRGQKVVRLHLARAQEVLHRSDKQQRARDNHAEPKVPQSHGLDDRGPLEDAEALCQEVGHAGEGEQAGRHAADDSAKGEAVGGGSHMRGQQEHHYTDLHRSGCQGHETGYHSMRCESAVEVGLVRLLAPVGGHAHGHHQQHREDQRRQQRALLSQALQVLLAGGPRDDALVRPAPFRHAQAYQLMPLPVGCFGEAEG
mmetsp:Transcript_24887/g.71830  ORF Transcript_24887/g.71830 Transcript_24887/m.71830 type:complete len:209 (-) Transcript_24887:1428-2054(-)